VSSVKMACLLNAKSCILNQTPVIFSKLVIRF